MREWKTQLAEQLTRILSLLSVVQLLMQSKLPR